MKVTSAYANKMLKQLDEDKEYWTALEDSSCVYTVVPGEEAIVPEYDYKQVADEIEKIDNRIQTIKHAINKSNVESMIEAEGTVMSVDTALVKMAQLNKRKSALDFMRKQPDKKIKTDRYAYNNIEYQYINFDPKLIKSEFERISKEIMDIQMALDKHNQTDESVEFEF